MIEVLAVIACLFIGAAIADRLMVLKKETCEYCYHTKRFHWMPGQICDKVGCDCTGYIRHD